MSRRPSPAVLKSLVLAAVFTLPLSGCGYDYLQNTDRVAYRAGDAVKANLESETTNPSKRSMYWTKGLGKNGPVGPTSGVAATGSGAPTVTTSTTTPAPPSN